MILTLENFIIKLIITVFVALIKRKQTAILRNCNLKNVYKLNSCQSDNQDKKNCGFYKNNNQRSKDFFFVPSKNINIQIRWGGKNFST